MALDVAGRERHFTLQPGQAAGINLWESSVDLFVRRTQVSGLTIVRVSGLGGTAGELLVSVPGKVERRYKGILEVRAAGNVLEAILITDRELAVASAVAAESALSRLTEAMKAQAVVTRSNYVLARPRHSGFDFCDTTHCQVLREPVRPGSAAEQAASETAGLIIAYAGAPVVALFSASCGGQTRTLADAGLEPQEYPYFSVPCFPCRRETRESTTRLPRGHGVGLCQFGAAAMAREGATFRDILEHYFPNVTVAPRQ
jgi:peptidoglycan hydrolase-like amidase